MTFGRRVNKTTMVPDDSTAGRSLRGRHTDGIRIHKLAQSSASGCRLQDRGRFSGRWICPGRRLTSLNTHEHAQHHPKNEVRSRTLMTNDTQEERAHRFNDASTRRTILLTTTYISRPSMRPGAPAPAAPSSSGPLPAAAAAAAAAAREAVAVAAAAAAAAATFSAAAVVLISATLFCQCSACWMMRSCKGKSWEQLQRASGGGL